MVGIAGAVPNPNSEETHVRLGDIVVSGEFGVIKYDFVKQTNSRFIPRHPPRAPGAPLLEAARRLEARALAGDRPWAVLIERAKHLPSSSRPDEATDMLADSETDGAFVTHPPDPNRFPGRPRVFLGTIACADRLLKNATVRDSLRDQHGVRAVEMESSGIAEATWSDGAAFIVVRGTCDYCDGLKGDSWQGYAAAVAAAYARALLEELPRADLQIATIEGSGRVYAETSTSGYNNAFERSRSTDVGAAVATIQIATTALEGEFNAQLDLIREKLPKNPRAVLDEISALRNRIWSTASPIVRARIVALTG
jgi:nucleoside phosphorylase